MLLFSPQKDSGSHERPTGWYHKKSRCCARMCHLDFILFEEENMKNTLSTRTHYFVKKTPIFDRFVHPFVECGHIYTCGLPASAVAIISGWGGLEMWGTGALTGSPRGRRTHKVVIHQQRRRRNTAFLKLFLINIWETNPAVDTRSARSLKKFQFCGCKGAPLPKISVPRICPTSQGE